jgi:hypothetical protein
MLGARYGLSILGQVENPVRTEMEEIARRSGLGFIINTVLDGEKRIATVVAGDVVAAHRRGVAVAEQIYSSVVPELVDIAIVSSHPADRDLWQGVKAICSAAEIVRPGGQVILLTPSYEGVSPEHPCLLGLASTPWRNVLADADEGRLDDEIGASCHIQLGLARDKVGVTLVSDGVSPAEAERMGADHAETVAEALDQALAQLGKGARVGVVTEGGEMLLRAEMDGTSPQPKEVA